MRAVRAVAACTDPDERTRDSYWVFDWQEDVPWIKNNTKRVIGSIKMRNRTVRRYKCWLAAEAGSIDFDRLGSDLVEKKID